MKTMRISPIISSPHFPSSISHQPIAAAGRAATFRCRASSSFNASSTTSDNQPNRTNGTEKNRTHLANLEKLLLNVTDDQQAPAAENPIREKSTAGGSSGPINSSIFEGINLNRFPWLPLDSNYVDEASAVSSSVHLSRLHQFLSASQDPSPRNHIGGRWREFHGSKDWVGLLDPLEENLRREIIRYGEMVQAAYRSFDMDPSAPSTSSTSSQTTTAHAHAHDDFLLPDKSYKVTKHLYATSSINMPKWVDEVMPNLGWMTQRSSRIGYVAVCEDKQEIQRMGRRDVVISLRGTLTCLEWAENMRDLLVPLASEPSGQRQHHQAQPRVECGFLSLFTTSAGKHVPSLAESITEEVQRLTRFYKGESLSVTIIGHSLGAALSLLAADHLAITIDPLPPVAVFSFGGPRVGNRAFADRMQSRDNVKVLRVVNVQDVVTRVPGMLVSEEMEKVLREKGVGHVLDSLDRCGPWAYAHVGEELRVETKMSPYLKPDADMACCHDLEAYLHLVDGFAAKDCPFRENAKRSLKKLLSEQGSNIKKLYMSKAKTLRKNPCSNFQTMEGLSSSASNSTSSSSSIYNSTRR